MGSHRVVVSCGSGPLASGSHWTNEWPTGGGNRWTGRGPLDRWVANRWVDHLTGRGPLDKWVANRWAGPLDR